MNSQIGNKTEWQIANPEFRDFVKEVEEAVDEKYTSSVSVCEITGVLDKEISYPLLYGVTFYVCGNEVIIRCANDDSRRKECATLQLTNYKNNIIREKGRFEFNQADKVAKIILSHCISDSNR